MKVISASPGQLEMLVTTFHSVGKAFDLWHIAAQSAMLVGGSASLKGDATLKLLGVWC